MSARRQDSFPQSYFDEASVYARYAERSAHELIHWYESLVRGIERTVGPITSPRINALDAGCGYGPSVELLRRRSCEVIGADVSLYALKRADELTPAPLVQSSVLALPVRSESFDLVTAFELLEHLPDPFAGLAELVRVARRGGRVIATTPNPFSSLLPGYDAWSDPTHVSVLSPARWRQALHDAGLDEVRVFTVLNPPFLWRRFPGMVRAWRLPVLGPTIVLAGRRCGSSHERRRS